MKSLKRNMALVIALILTFSFIFSIMPSAAAAGITSYDCGIEAMPSGSGITISPTVMKDGVVPDTVPDSGYYIDLSAETLYMPKGAKVAAYSVDGGTKWTAKPIGKAGDVYNISKLLDKGCILVLASQYDEKAKAPAAGAVPQSAASSDTSSASPSANASSKGTVGATVITFPEIAARPKAEKPFVNYLVYADITGMGTGCWTVTSKDGDSTLDVQISKTKDGKVPDGEWGLIPSGGLTVAALPKDGKPVKYTFLTRTAPRFDADGYMPASKITKISVQSLGKAVAVKADYKKELLKMKTGMNAYFGNIPQVQAAEGVLPPNLVSDEGIATEGKYACEYALSSDAAKAGINLSGILKEKSGTGEPATVTLWMQATAKKPATVAVVYQLAFRATAPLDAKPVIANGKISLPKGIEVYDENKSKWGKLPKATGAASNIKIRSAATAKAGKVTAATKKADNVSATYFTVNDTSGTAASTYAYLQYDWTEIVSGKKTKEGVSTAKITAAENEGIADTSGGTGDATANPSQSPVAQGDIKAPLSVDNFMPVKDYELKNFVSGTDKYNGYVTWSTALSQDVSGNAQEGVKYTATIILTGKTASDGGLFKFDGSVTSAAVKTAFATSDAIVQLSFNAERTEATVIIAFPAVT